MRSLYSLVASMMLLSLGGCSKATRAQAIRVEPATALTVVGTEVKFEAIVEGTLQKGVRWELGTTGDLPVELAGTIAVDGTYTAPKVMVAPFQNLIEVRAISVLNDALVGKAIVRLARPPVPSGGPSEGGHEVEIIGAGFFADAPPSIYFDDIAATEVRVLSENVIRATTPAHGLGPVAVKIVYPTGDEITFPDAYRYGAGTFVLDSGTQGVVCNDVPFVVKSADIDNCGAPEIITFCFYQGTVAVSQANNQGPVGEPRGFATSAGFYSHPDYNNADPYYALLHAYHAQVSTFDLDRDGFQDLFVASQTGLEYFRNLGNESGCGTWRGFELTATAVLPDSDPGDSEPPAYGQVLVNDMNGDRFPDIVTREGNILNAYLGTLAGANLTFGGPTFTQTLAGGFDFLYPYQDSITMGDVTGDGFVDIARADTAGRIELFPGIGNGAFAGAISVAIAGHQAISVTTGDVNGDGALDIVYGVRGNVDTVGFASWNGTALVATNLTIGLTLYQGKIFVRDFNADGVDDIALIHNPGTSAADDLEFAFAWGPFPNLTFHRAVMPVVQFDSILGNVRYEYGVADLGKDGVPELMTPNFVRVQDGPVTPFLNTLAGYWDGATPVVGPRTRTLPAVPTGIKVASIGAARESAAVVALAAGDDAIGLLKDVNASALDRTITLSGSGTTSVQSFKVSDSDGDAIDDLLVIDAGDLAAVTPSVWYVPGSSNDFGLPLEVRLSESVPAPAAGFAITDAALGDIDGDGYADLVAGTALAGTKFPGEVRILWGVPGGFDSSASIIDANVHATGIEVSDLDIDGDIDIVLLDGPRNRLAVVENLRVQGGVERTEILATPEFTAVMDAPVKMELLDLNHDYLPEVALLGAPKRAFFDNAKAFSTLTDISVLYNVGARAFMAPAQATMLGAVRDLQFGDVNGDGITDLLATSSDVPRATAVFMGQEPVGFELSNYIYTGERLVGTALWDVDGDGLAELLSATSAAGGQLRLAGNKSY